MKKCATCEKTSRMAGTRILLRGHYNPTNWSRKYPNLQTIKLPNSFRGFKAGSSILICTQCIRTIGKAARIEKKKALKAEKAAKTTAAPATEVKSEAPKAEKPKAKKAAKKEAK